MRTQSRSEVTVDLIDTRTATGELTKLGLFLGYELNLTHDEDHARSVRATLIRHNPTWLATEIAALIGIEAMAHDKKVDDVLAQARAQLERWHFPMDTPPSDARGIGEGHVEGQ